MLLLNLMKLEASMKTKIYYSHGKLLLTAEYVVLDGANALAMPTKKGQYLSVQPIEISKIIWKSFDEQQNIWFETEFEIDLKKNRNNSKEEITLLNILQTAKKINPGFLKGKQGYLVCTRLTFNRQFGLGSSSTLIANIAQWAKVNPFELLQQSFGGSGYDIACANSNGALTYNRNNNKPVIKHLEFNLNFNNQVYFIYLNKKQDSKLGIQRYKNLNTTIKQEKIKAISSITQQLINCTTITGFNDLINQHEQIISTLIDTPTVQETLFKDYTNGCIKSLGAWGGDFIMVTVKNKIDLAYFKANGYTTIISFKNMIL